jgi:hypothetical protein
LEDYPSPHRHRAVNDRCAQQAGEKSMKSATARSTGRICEAATIIAARLIIARSAYSLNRNPTPDVLGASCRDFAPTRDVPSTSASSSFFPSIVCFDHPTFLDGVPCWRCSAKEDTEVKS